MRQVSPRIRVALLGAALFVCGQTAVRADPVAPAVLVPALDVYIDKMIAIHDGTVACPGAKAVTVDAANWQQAKAVFLATLWASGFPTDFVRTETTRLGAPPGPKPDCTDPAVVAYFKDPSKADWRDLVENTLKALELNLVATPVEPQVWTKIKGMMTAETSPQRRLFDCIAVSDPVAMPAMVKDWDAMIAQLGSHLVAAGLPHDEINDALSSVEANTLWHRVPAAAEAPLRASCAKDNTWVDRFGNFAYLTLGPEATKLLPAPAADASAN